MDTIYEHNISEEELKILSKMTTGRVISIKKYYLYNLDDDLKNADLYRLYSIRGKSNIAKKYLDRIEDDILKYYLVKK